MLIEHWDLVAADLISQYACNVYDQQQLHRVTWQAGRCMIGGLFAIETRISSWYEHEYGKAKTGKG